MAKVMEKTPGVVLAALIAIPAWLIGEALPIVGSPVLGILFGMLIAFFNRLAVFEQGVTFTSRKLLQYSVILLGFGMNLYQIFRVGSQTLLLMAFTLSAAFAAAYAFGRLLKVNGKTAALVGVGTAICGGSAIAAAAPVIRATEEEVAHAISTIFLFNVIAAFLFPVLGHMLGMTDYSFGLWAGTAVNDTSSVVAAGYTYSSAAGDLAVIVKLTRTLMIVPVTLALALLTLRGEKAKKEAAAQTGGYSLIKIFPWFILGFVGASVLHTFVPLPGGTDGMIVQAGKFIIVMAMAAIGLNSNLAKLVKNGGKPLFLGFACWAVLCATSLVVQFYILKT